MFDKHSLDKHITGDSSMNNPANVVTCPECNGENWQEALRCEHCNYALKSDQEVNTILKNESGMENYEKEQMAKDIQDLWKEYRKRIDKAWKLWETERNRLLKKGSKDDLRMTDGYNEYERKSAEAWVDYKTSITKMKEKTWVDYRTISKKEKGLQ